MPIAELPAVVARLESQLGPLEGDPEPLGGGITNHNVSVRMGGERLVIRLCSPGTELLGIDRATEELATRRAAALGIGPEVVAYLPDEGALVTRWIDGGTLSADQVREPAALARIAGAMRAFHDGEPLPTAFDVVALAAQHLDLARAPDPRAGALLALGRRIDAALSGPEHDPVPCHNDLLSANFVGSGDGLRIVDWEYAGMNDRYFDLANLAVNNGFSEDDERALLQTYFGQRPDAARLASLRLMRIVSDLREAAWGAVQDGRSALNFDYAAYSREHVDRLAAAAADPRVEEWLAAAA